MSDIGLSANLEVKADGVESGVNKSITSLEALQNEIVKVQDQLAKASDDPSFNKLATKYNNLAKNIEILSKGEIKVAPVDLKPINDAGEAIEKVGTKTANLSNIMNRNLHGVADLFIAPNRAAMIFANDIPQLITRFNELKAAQDAIAAEGGVAKTSMQLLTESFNPLGLGVSLLAISLIHVVPKIYDWATGADEAKKKADELKKSHDELVKSFQSGYNKTGDEIAKIQSLVAAMTDLQAPLKDRQDKYNQIIALYPQLIDLMGKEKDATDKAKDSYPALVSNVGDATDKFSKLAKTVKEDLIPALTKLAISNGFFAQMQKIGQDIAATTGQIDELNKKSNSLTQEFGKNGVTFKANPKALKPLEDQLKAQQSLLESTTSEWLKYGDAASKVLGGTSQKDYLQHQLDASKAYLGTLKQGTPEFEKQAEIVKENQKALDAYSKTSIDAKSTAEKLSDAITQIQRKQESLNNAFSKGSITNVQYYKQSIDLLTTSIQNLHDKYNLPFDGKILSGLQTQLDKLKVAAPVNLTALKGDSGDIKTIANYMAHIYDEANKEAVKQFKAASKVGLSDLIQPQLDSFTAAESIAKKLAGQKAAIDMTYAVNPKLELDEASKKLSADTQAISELIQKHLKGEISDKDYDATIKNLKIQYDTDSISAQVESANKKLTSTLQGLADSSLEALGTAIGSGDFSNIGSDFLEALGKGIEQFGEQIVERVTAFLALKNTLFAEITSGNWEAALATGVGLVVLGAAIEAFAKKGAKGSSSSTSTGSYASTYTPSYYSPSQTTSGSNTAASAFGGSTNIAANVGNSVGSTINNTMEAIPIEGSFELKGSNLYASVKRTEKNKTR